MLCVLIVIQYACFLPCTSTDPAGTSALPLPSSPARKAGSCDHILHLFVSTWHLGYYQTRTRTTIRLHKKHRLIDFPSLSCYFFFTFRVKKKHELVRGGHARSCSEHGGLHLIESEESSIKIPRSDGLYRSFLLIFHHVRHTAGFSCVCFLRCDVKRSVTPLFVQAATDRNACL